MIKNLEAYKKAGVNPKGVISTNVGVETATKWKEFIRINDLNQSSLLREVLNQVLDYHVIEVYENSNSNSDKSLSDS